MPAALPLPLRVLAAAALVVGVMPGWSSDASAQGHAAEHSEHGQNAPVPEIAASAAAGAPATWPDSPARVKAVRGPQDPMEMLRQRLAKKLGAVRAPGVDDPNVLRVVAKTPATASPAPTAPTGASPVATDAPARRMAKASSGPMRRTPRNAGGASSADLPQPALAGWREAGQRILPLGRPRPGPWSYDGSSGPQTWAELSPEFSKCATGSRQSPIDIRDGIKVELDAVRFDYRPGAFSVVDTGHTVQVNVEPGSSIEVLGRRYELQEFHFHRPSEERIDGKQFDMVVHLVHRDTDGRMAVVAVLLERGSAQPLIQSVWNNLPLEKGEELAARVSLDPNDLLPAGRGYYTYMGSITTPPCSEGVLWMVMKEPVQVSDDQIGIFSRLYPMNARPVQPLSGRLIKESN